MVVTVVAEVALAQAQIDRINRAAQRIVDIIASGPGAVGPVDLILETTDQVVVGVGSDVHPVYPLSANAEMRASRSTKDSDTKLARLRAKLIFVEIIRRRIAAMDTVAVVIYGWVDGILATGVNIGGKIVTILATPLSTAESLVGGEEIAIQVNQGQVLLERLLEVLNDPIPDAISNSMDIIVSVVLGLHGSVELVGKVLGVHVLLVRGIQQTLAGAQAHGLADLVRIGTSLNELNNCIVDMVSD